MKASNQTPARRPHQQQPRFAHNSHRRSSKETQLKRGDPHHEQLDKPQKTVWESAASSLTPVSEVKLAAKRESIDSTSEVIDCDDRPTELSEVSFVLSENNPVLSASSETPDLSYFSTSLKIINDDDMETVINGSEESSEASKLAGNLDAQVIVELLKEARIQLLSASDVDQRSKNILYALIKILIKDFHNLPKKEEEEVDRFSKIVSAKVRIGFILLLLWIVSVLVVLISNSSGGRGRSSSDMTHNVPYYVQTSVSDFSNFDSRDSI